jgi:cytochrome c-type biogenesis protein CcmF
LRQGETIQVHDYTLTFERMIARQKPHRFETKAVIHVNNDDQINTNMSPQMNFYPMSKQPIASPAIRSTLLSDLYLTLNNFEKDGSEVSLKVITSPGVSWIWIGGLIILLSGLLAMMKRKKENV